MLVNAEHSSLFIEIFKKHKSNHAVVAVGYHYVCKVFIRLAVGVSLLLRLSFGLHLSMFSLRPFGHPSAHLSCQNDLSGVNVIKLFSFVTDDEA
jgi:hypothetical protein